MQVRLVLLALLGSSVLAGAASAQVAAGGISAPPAALGNYDSVQTALRGDWSHAHGEEYRITGADTLGRPRTGYRFTPEATPHYLYLYNASGWNQDTGGNGGRTAASAYRTQGFQAGQGDLILNSAGCFVTGSKPRRAMAERDTMAATWISSVAGECAKGPSSRPSEGLSSRRSGKCRM